MQKETRGIGGEDGNNVTGWGTQVSTSQEQGPTVEADRPGPRWATMAPETARIQLCMSSGLSACGKEALGQSVPRTPAPASTNPTCAPCDSVVRQQFQPSRNRFEPGFATLLVEGTSSGIITLRKPWPHPPTGPRPRRGHKPHSDVDAVKQALRGLDTALHVQILESRFKNFKDTR